MFREVLCDLGVNSPPPHQGRCQHTGATSLLHSIDCTVRLMILRVTVMLAQLTLSDKLALSSALPEKLLFHVPPVIHPEPFVGSGYASHSLHFVFHHPLPYTHLAVTRIYNSVSEGTSDTSNGEMKLMSGFTLNYKWPIPAHGSHSFQQYLHFKGHLNPLHQLGMHHGSTVTWNMVEYGCPVVTRPYPSVAKKSVEGCCLSAV